MRVVELEKVLEALSTLNIHYKFDLDKMIISAYNDEYDFVNHENPTRIDIPIIEINKGE